MGTEFAEKADRAFAGNRLQSPEFLQNWGISSPDTGRRSTHSNVTFDVSAEGWAPEIMAASKGILKGEGPSEKREKPHWGSGPRKVLNSGGRSATTPSQKRSSEYAKGISPRENKRKGD